MAKVSIRPTVASDVSAICAVPIHATMRAYTLEIDGKPIGLAGLMRKDDRHVLFGETLAEGRNFPFAIYKGVRKVMDWVEKSGLPVVAIADPNIPRSTELLLHLGFKHIDTCQYGEVYRWDQE